MHFNKKVAGSKIVSGILIHEVLDLIKVVSSF